MSIVDRIYNQPKGAQKLVHDNFIFVKDPTTEEKVYWKCELFQEKCKCKVHVTCNQEEEAVIKTK